MAFKKILLEGDAASPSDNAPQSVGTTAAQGTGAACSRDDHVHDIGTGAIDAAALFAAGVVDSTTLGAAAVTAGKIATGGISAAGQFAAGVVDAAAIAASAVGNSEIDNTATDIAMAQLIFTPAATGTGTTEATSFYDSDDDHPYIYDGS